MTAPKTGNGLLLLGRWGAHHQGMLLLQGIRHLWLLLLQLRGRGPVQARLRSVVLNLLHLVQTMLSSWRHPTSMLLLRSYVRQYQNALQNAGHCLILPRHELTSVRPRCADSLHAASILHNLPPMRLLPDP